MPKKWNILFCNESDQDCPVTEFINTCHPVHQVKLLRILSLLEEKGPILPRPYADLLHSGIHELRVSLSRDRVRILYFFCYGKFIVLYHAFLKNTRQVPEKYIDAVIDYREQFLAETSEEELERQACAVF